MLPYTKENVGKKIATGGEHKVYYYGEDKVIKFPFGPRYWFGREQYCENLKRDEHIVRQYFGGYLVEREINFFTQKNQASYIIIEPFLTGRHLQRKDLKDPQVKEQFEELVNINQQFMKQENLSAEFFGIKGLLLHGKSEAANIMFDPETKKITLTDAGIMHFGKHKDQQILISSVTHWAIKKQQILINLYLTEK